MEAKTTWFLTDIFPSYEDFKQILDEDKEEFNQFLFKILNRAFYQVNVRYTEKDSFINEFLNVYDDVCSKYIKKGELIKAMYNLSDEEITINNSQISNTALNPNNKVDEPLKPLNYISDQNYFVYQKGKSVALYDFKQMLPRYIVNEVVDEFRYLFSYVCYGAEVIFL